MERAQLKIPAHPSAEKSEEGEDRNGTLLCVHFDTTSSGTRTCQYFI